MAQIGSPSGFVDKRITQGQITDVRATPANYASHASVAARLTAINGTYFSAAKLPIYTYNDKLYAMRMNDDAGSL